MQTPSDAPSTPRSTEDTSPVRVLLVEDDLDLAEVMAEFLSIAGLDVRTALSGHEALEVAPPFRPHLVLCDLNLPDIGGLEVVRQLRSISSTARSYIVILSAMARMSPTPHETEEPGVDAFICKPISIEAVRTLVEEVGRRRQNTHL